MSQRRLHLWIPTSGLFVLIFCGSALRADGPGTEQLAGEEFGGEIVLIESKNGSTVAIEQPRIRMIGGQGFVGGVVLSRASSRSSVQAVGSRIWIATTDISRIIEFDSKAQFTGTTPTASKEIATIEALGGRIERDNKQPGSSVVSVDFSGCQKLKDEDLQVLASFLELRVLDLSGTATSDVGLRACLKITFTN